METKKDRVKAVKPYGTQDQYGNYSYIVEFENGDNGFFKTKTDQVGSIGLVIGQEFEYTIEKKLSKAGKEFFVIAKPKAAFNPGGGRQVNEKSIIAQVALKCACQTMQQSQEGHSPEKVLAMADKFNSWLLTKSGL